MYTLQNYSTINIYFAYQINPKDKVFQLHFSVWLEFQTVYFKIKTKPFEASFLECFFLDNNNLVTKRLDSQARFLLCKVEINTSKSIYFFFFKTKKWKVASLFLLQNLSSSTLCNSSEKQILKSQCQLKSVKKVYGGFFIGIDLNCCIRIL